MPTKVLKEPGHIDALAVLLRGRKLPLTVSWVQGASLSRAQQRLSFRWYQDIARQLGDLTPAEARAQCKVVFAAPILCEASETFRISVWEKLRRMFTHEELLVFVRETELPMTSLLSVKQMTQYLDDVQRCYSDQGVKLTDPEAMKYESEFR